MEILYQKIKDPRGESDGDIMPGIKRGEDLDVRSWSELIEETAPPKPEGYSTAEEIAIKKDCNLSTLSTKLRTLREKGLINCMRARSSRGKTIWVYKD